MDINTLTQQLINNRLMQTTKEFEDFEKTIIDILNLKDINHIQNLCMGFHDETECPEVMFSLVHAIESYDKIFNEKETLNRLLESTTLMLPHAKDWNQILHKRILNHKTLLVIYKDLIKKSDNKIKNTILEILIEIKYDNPENFGKKVEEIILYVNNDK